MVMNRVVTMLVVVAVSSSLVGCVAQPGQRLLTSLYEYLGIADSSSDGIGVASYRQMPSWLDFYRQKKLVSVATVDHVVIVTFETLGERDEVFRHYTGKFGNEENFISYRDTRDIISFIREGFGVKITMLDQSRNLWSLEYHRQAI
ncbi:MAG: hypothetical protein HGA97_08445 [Chlorobiaceae bacterium]|nr:hypothetical protein [Chlorobiaceae bacterium]